MKNSSKKSMPAKSTKMKVGGTAKKPLAKAQKGRENKYKPSLGERAIQQAGDWVSKNAFKGTDIGGFRSGSERAVRDSLDANYRYYGGRPSDVEFEKQVKKEVKKRFPNDLSVQDYYKKKGGTMKKPLAKAQKGTTIPKNPFKKSLNEASKKGDKAMRDMNLMITESERAKINRATQDSTRNARRASTLDSLYKAEPDFFKKKGGTIKKMGKKK